MTTALFAFLCFLGIVAIWGIVATVTVTWRDGYRRQPSRRVD
ncbi:hypothetical protein [Luethyella okanaganae]|uniref:MetS family NSS transporter small subunit n=1 Tax=Luethyella okanaganae TaxID=69372 RepID=A0ABW1VG07_9MICO